MKNVRISSKDVDIAEEMFETDVFTCKGKWTKTKPPIVTTNDIIELLPELNVAGMELDLAINVVYVNNKVFLNAIDRRIKCPTCIILGTRKKDEGHNAEVRKEAIAKVIRKYNQDGVYV